MDGVRTAEGGEGVTGAMIRARIWVDGRLAGGLQALMGAPMAAYSGCGERDGGIGHGKRRSQTGLARVCGDVGLAGESVADGRRQAGSGRARNRARARSNWASQGQRCGRCNSDPEFDPASYTFSVSEDASTADTVGTVSATDPDEGDTVSYSITAGNGDGKFMIDGGTGEITVNAALDYETTDEYRLTVEASDERGGTDTATVTVTVTDVAEDPPPVLTGLTVSLADAVFSLTWDAVTGAAKYEAQWRTDAADAVWTALTKTTAAATTYTPAGGPACGTEYQFRVRAYGDGETYGEVWGQDTLPPFPRSVDEVVLGRLAGRFIRNGG